MKKIKKRIFGCAAIAVLIGAAFLAINIFSGSGRLDPESVQVIWKNDNLEEIDLSDSADKEKIVSLLNNYMEKDSRDPEERPEPKKGDLDIQVKDRNGETHDFYLSHEGGEYRYSIGSQEYSIRDGEELYQGIASLLS